MRNKIFIAGTALLLLSAMAMTGCKEKPQAASPSQLGGAASNQSNDTSVQDTLDAAKGLLDTASKLSNDASVQDAQKALDATKGLLDTASKLSNDASVQDAQKALDATKGLLDTASKLSNDASVQDAQKALDAANQAANMLKGLPGF